MVGRARAIRFAISVAAAAALSGGSAWAVSGGLDGHSSASDPTTSTSAPCKPGWGYGDDNHCHLGPAGRASSTTSSTDSSSTSSTSTSSTETSSTSSTTASSTTPTTAPCKPGWGYGDRNHCHSGPPGLNKPHHGDAKP